MTTLFKYPAYICERIIALALLCRNSSPGCTDCVLHSCYCLKCYQKYLRYFTKYSYIFLAIFGEGYYEAARKSYYLINRNRERIFVPAKAGDFGMFIIKLTITLSGTALGFSLVLLSSTTPFGQPTSDLVAPSFIGIVSFLVSGYIAQIFGGSMQACMNTIIICGACDEEMFTREQRYMYIELRKYLDQIYEEMTEQQRENKEAININSKKVYQNTKVLDDGGESTSVMKPFFNQGSEISAPVKALNVDDLDDENIFAVSKPNIVFNQSFDPSNNSFMDLQNSKVQKDSSIRSQENTMRGFKGSSERSFLQPENRSLLGKSAINNASAINNLTVVQNKSFMDNRSAINNMSAIDKRSTGNEKSFREANNFLSPNRLGFSTNKTDKALNRSVDPRIEASNSSFLNQNKSYLQDINKSSQDLGSKIKREGSNSSFQDYNRSFVGNESFKSAFAEEDPIQVYNESSIEIEPDNGVKPVFQR